MTEEIKKNKYGVPFRQEQLGKGKKGVEDKIEELGKAAAGEPKSQTEHLIGSIMNNYRSALGPHKPDDARVQMFHRLLVEYTKTLMIDCLETLVEAQTTEFMKEIKGDGNQ